jgi:hypothetical protein
MKIEEHISELLFEHDCVIVPDFGGFVCNYAPANIDPVKHLFEPPGKRILFNKGLTRNDGLLAHHISGKMKLPYSEALDTISKEVTRYKQDIAKDKRLTLDNIGLLYVDEKGSLLFQQDNKLNYLADSFGLSAFYHIPAVEFEKTEKEAKVIPIYNERKKARTYVAAAVVAILVVSAFFFNLLEKQTNMRFSSFSFFNKKEAAQYVYSPARYKELPPAPASEPFYVTVTDAKDLTPTAVSVTVPSNPAPAIPNPTPVKNSAVPVSTKIVPATNNSITTISSSKYLIIVGSFSIKENAEKLISEFSKQNLHVSIIGRTPAGLYMVGYGNLQTHDAAVAERMNFSKKFGKDSWIKAN